MRTWAYVQGRLLPCCLSAEGLTQVALSGGNTCKNAATERVFIVKGAGNISVFCLSNVSAAPYSRFFAIFFASMARFFRSRCKKPLLFLAFCDILK